MLTFIALAAIAAGATLIVHHRQWSHGSAPNFVLVVIPAALLFVILPVAPLMVQTVRSTQPIGNAGTDFSLVGELCLQIERTLWWGSVAILVTMAFAALLQVAAGGTRPASAGDDDPTRNVGAWIILIACTAPLLPTALLMFFVERVPRLAIQALEASTTNPVSGDFSAFSESITVRLMVGTWFAAGLSFVEVAAGVLALVAAGSIRHQRMPRAPWIAFAAMMLIASLNVYRLQGEVRWIERATAAVNARTVVGSPQASLPQPAPTTGEESEPFRIDGVYRTEARPNGTFDYWVFRRGGLCWPYSAPNDHALPTVPTVGHHWTCTVNGDALVVKYSKRDRTVRTDQGTMPDRDTIVMGGVTYKFVDGQRLR